MKKRNICLCLLGVLATCLGASTYRPATIVSVNQQLRTEKHDSLHNTLLDSDVMTTTDLVYLFKVRCGDEVYSSEYIYPGNTKDAPKTWKTQVQIRVQGGRMFIKDPNGAEFDTKIVKHIKP